MVAISLYRGKLHRPSDAPRQWLMPARKITLKDFKILLQRRSRALSRLQSTTSNLNPNSGTEQPQSDPSLEYIVKDTNALKVDDEKLVDELPNSNEDDNAKKGSSGDDCLVIPSGELEVADVKAVVTENDSNAAVDDLPQEDKTQATSEHQLVPSKDDTLSDKEKRKKEVEEKLQILNERKHKLVQVLKQILHAEEELRRRSNVQGITGCPSVSLQVDVTNDSGSMSKHITPRPGSEGNCAGDVEGVDGDDVSNQNMHSRNMTRMSSMSPSSDSLHRRAPFSMTANFTHGIHMQVSNPSRGTLGVAASSPSRFAPTPTVQQGNPASLPTVSVTGTNYVASSPSPAGSGGTSVFRDARLPSPWN
ncbi:hypothetical protein L6452_34394 [Arctium lappa]|uniref:Uncharacterized protein n=1 Tax=Arctium lappa TaxID=4217 RepID=A0ACB8YJ31_ARCLA|nr:hypothetical protein L6452_34394 [Arctium lappa]